MSKGPQEAALAAYAQVFLPSAVIKAQLGQDQLISALELGSV
jgi:hypothetical protein